jgi:hypothetical protein
MTIRDPESTATVAVLAQRLVQVRESREAAAQRGPGDVG